MELKDSLDSFYVFKVNQPFLEKWFDYDNSPLQFMKCVNLKKLHQAMIVS